VGIQSLLHRVAGRTSLLIGSASSASLAFILVVGLVALGLRFGFSDRWLAGVSAALSVVTFLLVFLLQYRENRDTAAIQLKLNELLRAVEGAREHEFADLEHMAEQEQEDLSREHRRHRARLSESSPSLASLDPRA